MKRDLNYKLIEVNDVKGQKSDILATLNLGFFKVEWVDQFNGLDSR